MGAFAVIAYLFNKKNVITKAKEIIKQYHTENLDPDGRGYKNLMRMMMKDGIFKYLPKHDNAWVEFLTPFMKLTRKEKRRFKTKKRLI